MIRDALISAAKAIQKLVNSFAAGGEMLPLSLNDVYENILKFVVWVEDDEIVGCCALHPTWEDLAEVRSIAVSEKMKGLGIGYKLVEEVLKRAKKLGIKNMFLLTYVPGFFEKHGFKIVEKETLPKKIWSDCLKCTKFPDCDEIAMSMEL